MLSSTRNNTENENIGGALRGKSSVTQSNAMRGERLKFYGKNLVALIDGEVGDRRCNVYLMQIQLYTTHIFYASCVFGFTESCSAF